jgi:RNA polymerase sigma-70 factor (ECF subfamily)
MSDLPKTAEDAYLQYSSYVAAVAYRLIGRDAEIDDVVQEVFLRAVKGLHRLHDERAMKGWLATVTVRVVKRKMWKRGIARKLGFGTPPPDDGHSIAPGASPEQRALLGQVYKVMDRLPATQRLAWTLRYVQGEKLDDVAQQCGCSLATAKRHIKSAHEFIQKEVANG